MYSEICIDLGSSDVIVSAAEKGIISRQPCVMLLERDSGKLVAFGKEAMKIHAQSPSSYVLERPLIGGLARHLDKTKSLISLILADVCGREYLPERVIFSVPCDMGQFAEEAVVEAASQCGIKEAYVMYSPLAALMASEMNITNSYMIVDIGASKTSIMIMCKGNIAYSASVSSAGDSFDKAIFEYVFTKHGVKISSFTAENIKKKIGTVWGGDSPVKNVDVKTRKSDGSFSTIRISSDEMFIALEEPTAMLIEAICTAVHKIPTQYVNDVFSHGILLCGGGSLLGGLAKIIAGITGVDTYVLPNAPELVALGMASSLRTLSKKISPSIKNISKFCLKSLGGYGVV